MVDLLHDNTATEILLDGMGGIPRGCQLLTLAAVDLMNRNGTISTKTAGQRNAQIIVSNSNNHRRAIGPAIPNPLLFSGNKHCRVDVRWRLVVAGQTNPHDVHCWCTWLQIIHRRQAAPETKGGCHRDVGRLSLATRKAVWPKADIEQRRICRLTSDCVAGSSYLVVAFHASPSRIIALSIVTIFRMQAVIATFLCFPALTRRR